MAKDKSAPAARAAELRMNDTLMKKYTTAASARTTGVPCLRCAYGGPHHVGPGAGPHDARLVCGQCGAFVRWLPKPRKVVAE